MILRNFLPFLACLILTAYGTVSCTANTTAVKSTAATPPRIQSVPLESIKRPPGTLTTRKHSVEPSAEKVAEPPQSNPSVSSEKKLSAPPAREASKPETKTSAPNKALPRLEREVKRLAAQAGGTVGVGALHIESGQHFSFNGQKRFPMASAYKIPIAVQLLRRVDEGEVRLNQIVTLRSCDIHPGSGRLIKSFNKKEASYTVRELLELMLLISDNTASDALLKLAGGPAAVTSFMKTLGIEDITVSRSTLNMLADWRGIQELPSSEAFHVSTYNQLRDTVPASELETAQKRFYSDLRDSATPEGMTRLLAMIQDGTALSPESTSVLLKIMGRCQTGNSRIKRLIPPGMPVANKTGTIGPGMVNDAAILTLPGDAGHVALTIFIKASNAGVSQQEQAMAQISRYIYDYYYFQDMEPFEAAMNETCSLQNPESCSR